MAVSGDLDKLSQSLTVLNGQMQRMFGGGTPGAKGSQHAAMQNVGDYLQSAGLGKAGGMLKGLAGKNPLGFIASEAADRLGTAKDEFSSVLGARTPTAAFGHAARGAGAVLGDMPGSAVMTKLPAVLVESIDKLRDWNNSLHQANIQFADFSASMASVEAEQQARDIQLKRQQGDNRASSARDLAEAKSKLDRQLAPVEDAWAKLQNTLATWATTAASVAVKAGSFGMLNGEGSGTGAGGVVGADIHANEWMYALGEDERETRARRPGRLK
jgi:hypothetical protein